MPQLTVRPCRDETDFWRARAFLREAFLANGRRELSWPVARLDDWRMQRMGGTLAVVGGLTESANALYCSTETREPYSVVPWQRAW